MALYEKGDRVEWVCNSSDITLGGTIVDIIESENNIPIYSVNQDTVNGKLFTKKGFMRWVAEETIIN